MTIQTQIVERVVDPRSPSSQPSHLKAIPEARLPTNPWVVMLESIDQTICQTIRLWEEAGFTLADALQKYLNLSLSLESSCLMEGTPPSYLAARIDSVLESLHVVFDRQIAEARSILAQTRDRVLSPIYHFPEEVLSEIFMNIVFDFGHEDPRDINEFRIIEYYRRLHNLIGVCSSWRNTILSRGVFWSVVPMIYSARRSLRTEHATRLSLGRAQGRPLHFIAFLAYYHYDFVFAEHAPRFRTINISTGTEALEAMQRFLRSFLYICSQAPGPPPLSQLSLCHKYEPSYYNDLPDATNCVHNHSSPEDPFNTATKNLSILRIKGAQFNWNRMAFSHGLTELHLQDIMVGYDTSLVNLIAALSFATQLRDLKFIGVRSFPVQHQLVLSYISLPGLKSLLVRDLSYNTLLVLLSSIVSRSHHLTLFLTRNCRCINLLGDAQALDINIQSLYQLLGSVTVHTLLLSGGREYGWLSADQLGDLVLSMPQIEEMWVNMWDLDENSCHALERSSQPRAVFPNLRTLRFTQTMIRSEPAFKRIIISHCRFIHRLGFGVVLVEGGDITYIEGGWDEWLREDVSHPGVVELEYDDKPPEFEEIGWRMWS